MRRLPAVVTVAHGHAGHVRTRVGRRGNAGRGSFLRVVAWGPLGGRLMFRERLDFAFQDMLLLM